jgi:hypothetical protein
MDGRWIFVNPRYPFASVDQDSSTSRYFRISRFHQIRPYLMAFSEAVPVEQLSPLIFHSESMSLQ